MKAGKKNTLQQAIVWHIQEFLKCSLVTQFSSVAQSCLTLCDPMNCSMPGLPVYHQLPEFTQTHIHDIGDAIQPTYPLSSPYPPFNLSQHQGLFYWVSSLHQVAKVLGLQLQYQSFQWIFGSTDVGNLISGSSAFCKSSLNIWKFMLHTLLKPSLKDFEDYFSSMWNECNCAVVWTFFGIAVLWDWNENWPLPVLWPLESFPNLLAYWLQHFHGIIF